MRKLFVILCLSAAWLFGAASESQAFLRHGVAFHRNASFFVPRGHANVGLSFFAPRTGFGLVNHNNRAGLDRRLAYGGGQSLNRSFGVGGGCGVAGANFYAAPAPCAQPAASFQSFQRSTFSSSSSGY